MARVYNCDLSYVMHLSNDINLYPMIDSKDVTVNVPPLGRTMSVENFVKSLGPIAFNQRIRGIRNTGRNDEIGCVPIYDIIGLWDNLHQKVNEAKRKYSGWV